MNTFYYKGDIKSRGDNLMVHKQQKLSSALIASLWSVCATSRANRDYTFVALGVNLKQSAASIKSEKLLKRPAICLRF